MSVYFEVSAEWMQATGKGNAAKVFEVTRIIDNFICGPAFQKLVTLNRNGRDWVVSTARGRFVDSIQG